MYEIDESFTYTTLFLLRINLLFNDKRSISLIEALEGRRVLEWSLNNEGICFIEIDEQEEFMKFLSECKDMVHYKNGFIILNDGITEHNIDEKFTLIRPTKYLDYNPQILKYLKINKPIDFINKYCDLERNIEELYINNNGDNNVLDSLYREKEEILESIKNCNEEYIDMITSIYSGIYNDAEEDYIIFPINRARYLSSRHYDESTKINDLLYEPYQFAIFTDYPLFRTKVKHDFNRIIDDSAEEELNYTRDNTEKIDPNEEYYDATVDSSETDYDDNEDAVNYDITNIAEEYPEGFGACDNLAREQELFMLEYIRILESMKDKYKSISDELELVIKRLMYMVDNSNIGLYKGNDIDTVIKDYKDITDCDYMRIADEVMYFISEIFNAYYDRFCVRKILFVKTYYELTNDIEVINYINEFKDSKLYNHVYKIITGEYPGKVKRK